MKLKGINVIEQHVEKLVLLVMLLVFLAVIALQFLVQPNVVDVGGRTVPPEEIYSTLESDAQRLRNDVQNTEPTLPGVEVPELLAAYESAADASGLPEPLDIAFGPDAVVGGKVLDGSAGGPVTAMRLPAPIMPVGASYYATLDPFAVAAESRLQRIAPESGPADIVLNSVEATFDSAAFLELLRSAPEGTRVIPPTWWRDSVAVMRVEAERQEMTPAGWSDPVSIDTTAGTIDVLASVDESESLDDPRVWREVVRDASRNSEGLLRPEFVPAISGPEWVMPSLVEERAEQLLSTTEAEAVRRQIARLQERIDDIKSGPTRRRTTSNDQPRALYPGGVAPGGSGGGNENRRNNDAAEARQERQIERIESQIEELNAELQAMGFEPVDIRPRRSVPGALEQRPRRTAEDGPPRIMGMDDRRPRPSGVLSGDAVPFWFHDLEVEPGKVYRYRVRLVANNPIYGKGRLLDEEDSSQQALAQEQLVRGEWSAWTEPIEAFRRTYSYVTTATEDGSVNGASATVEVYHLYYGNYRRGSIKLEPGDVVSGAVRLPESLYLLDPSAIEQDTERAEIRDMIDRFFGGDRTEPLEEGEQLPPGIQAVGDRIPVDVDMLLLDIGAEPLATTDELGNVERDMVVYFTDSSGSIEIRLPMQDRDERQRQILNLLSEREFENEIREPMPPREG